MFVRAKDNKLVRARPTLVQQGGKRRAIAQQVTVESGALQKRRSGVGGTEYTTRDRLLAWQEDAVAGLSSRHDRSHKSNADRTRRQDSVSLVMHPLAGCKTRRHKPDEPVDVFVRPAEQAMHETRIATHLLAGMEFVEKCKDAVAINVSADGKTFGRFPTIGACVSCITVEPDLERIDAFGNCPNRYVERIFQPPPLQLPSKTVTENSRRRRKDGVLYEAQTARKLAIMLTVSGVSTAMANNRGAVRFACDAASDNKGDGPLIESMQTLSGPNSLMDMLMIRGDAWPGAEAYLNSLGLLEPIRRLFNGDDLEGLLAQLTKERLARERTEASIAQGRSVLKKSFESFAGRLSEESKSASARVADLAQQVHLLVDNPEQLAETRELLDAAEADSKSAAEASRSANHRAKEARKRRGAPSSAAGGAVAAVALAAAAALAPPSLERVPLNMSGPVPKCREEQERLFGLKMYEARLRPVLKRQRFYRWILNMWLYTTHEQRRLRALTSVELSMEERLARKKALYDQDNMPESADVRLKWTQSCKCKAFARAKRMRQIDERCHALYGACDEEGKASRDWRALAEDVLPEVEAVLLRAKLAELAESVLQHDGSITETRLAKAVLQRVRSMTDKELANAALLSVKCMKEDELGAAVTLSVRSITDGDESADELAEEEAMNDGARLTQDQWSHILNEEHVKFLRGARCCGKGLSKERADAKISKLLLCTSMSDDSEEEYMRRASLFWSIFW